MRGGSSVRGSDEAGAGIPVRLLVIGIAGRVGRGAIQWGRNRTAGRMERQDITEREGGDRRRPPMASVLMPVYNGARYLRQALDSVLSQTFGDFEFIIVDDGSTDDTPALLADVARRDPRIRVHRLHPNQGIVHALNQGLDRCRGRYVVRMDADDVALPDRLHRQVQFMEDHPHVVAAGGQLTYVDARGVDLGVTRGGDTERSLLWATPLLHPTVILRRGALEANGLRYEETFRYAEDYALWLRLSRVGELRQLDFPVLKYRVSGDATRFRHLKPVLASMLRAKRMGMRQLGIRPSGRDLVRMAAEYAALVVPGRILRTIYLLATFRRRVAMSE